MPKPSRCFSTSQVMTLMGRLASKRWSFPAFSQKSTTGLVCSLKTFSLLAMDYSLSSDLPLVFPLSSSLLLSSSQVHSKQMTDLRLTHFDISCSQTSMFSWPLGNPSSRYLPPKLQLSIFQRISLTIRLLEISFPSFMMALSYCPRGDPVLTSSRSRSPVDKWMKLYFLTSTSHWLSYKKQYVPLPEPGPPRTKRSSAGLGGRMCAAVSLSFNSAQTSSRLLVASTVIQLCLSSKLLTMGFVSASKVQILFFIVSGLSSALPLVLLLSVMRSIRVWVGQSKQMRFLTITLSASCFSNQSQFYWLRGKPSSRYLRLPYVEMPFSMSLTTMSEEISLPSLMQLQMVQASSPPFFCYSRKRSPVDKCLNLQSRIKLSA